MRTLLFFLTAVTLLFLSSCQCSCNCEFCSGCKNFTATNSITNKVVSRASFCTVGNMFTNDAFLDSCANFQKRFSDSLLVVSVDSAQTCIKQQSVKCDDTDKFKDYHCMCFK